MTARRRSIASAVLALCLLPAASIADESRFAAERRALLSEIQRDAEATAGSTKRPKFSARVIAAMDAVPRHRFVPQGSNRKRLREPPLADRARPDDLAAVHRRIDDGASRSEGAARRAGGGNGLGLPGGGAREARGLGQDDRDRTAARQQRRRAPPPARVRERRSEAGRRLLWLARARAVSTASSSPRRRLRFHRLSSSSSSRAAGWSFPSARRSLRRT